MFSFFKRQKVNINSITIPDFGWSKITDTKSKVQWVNPEETILISINFFNLPPDIPTIKNIESLRNFYRTSLSKMNGGIIEVEFVEKENIKIAKTIFKVPQAPTGMVYLASMTIPFENCSFVIKIQAFEAGITGIRDSIIANDLLEKGKITIGKKGYENWFYDPYDNNQKSGVLMNQSEQKIYDNDFPNHPLSVVRKIINEIEIEMIFNSDIEKLNPFMN